jgi:hypothetical protein
LQTPYYVALDHASKSIVLTVRGTLSLHDVIIDLSASSDDVDIPGVPPGTRSHSVSRVSPSNLLCNIEYLPWTMDAQMVESRISLRRDLTISKRLISLQQ